MARSSVSSSNSFLLAGRWSFPSSSSSSRKSSAIKKRSKGQLPSTASSSTSRPSLPADAAALSQTREGSRSCLLTARRAPGATAASSSAQAQRSRATTAAPSRTAAAALDAILALPSSAAAAAASTCAAVFAASSAPATSSSSAAAAPECGGVFVQIGRRRRYLLPGQRLSPIDGLPLPAPPDFLDRYSAHYYPSTAASSSASSSAAAAAPSSSSSSSSATLLRSASAPAHARRHTLEDEREGRSQAGGEGGRERGGGERTRPRASERQRPRERERERGRDRTGRRPQEPASDEEDNNSQRGRQPRTTSFSPTPVRSRSPHGAARSCSSQRTPSSVATQSLARRGRNGATFSYSEWWRGLQDGASAEEDVDYVAGSALYFVDVLNHRTSTRCAACNRILAEGASHDQYEEANRLPCILGFRVAAADMNARAEARDGRVGWVHAVQDCLVALHLPVLRRSRTELDVIFSRSVLAAQRAEVLECLTRTSQGPQQRSPRQARTLQVERWSYAATTSTHWGGHSLFLRRQGLARSSVDVQIAPAAAPCCVELVPRKLDEDLLNGLKRSGDDEDPLCIICMQDFAVGEFIVRLPCSHVFHSDCSSEWLRHRPVCPLDQVPVGLQTG